MNVKKKVKSHCDVENYGISSKDTGHKLLCLLNLYTKCSIQRNNTYIIICRPEILFR